MQPIPGRPLVRVGGRYELFSQLAAAPFGNLWAARIADGPEQGRIVAIRRIPKAAVLRTITAAQVASAAFTATEVRHPKVAAVLDAIEDPHEVAVVTEYVEGELLRSLQRRAGLRNEPIPDRIALRIGLDLLEALEHAQTLWMNVVHSAQPVGPAGSGLHGGVSPDSILIAVYGDPLLLDLGVAALLRSDPSVARHPDVAPHCAPEQLDPTGQADERTDVFSMGVILWELLANLPLFGSPKWTRFVARDGEDPAESQAAAVVQRRVHEAPIARLDALVRTHERVPKAVADIIGQALSRKSTARFASLSEFRAALSNLEPNYFANSDETRAWLMSVAGTSIQARQAALASLTGRSPDAPPFTDTTSPTLPPPMAAADLGVVELNAPDDAASQPPDRTSPIPDSKSAPPLPSSKRKPND